MKSRSIILRMREFPLRRAGRVVLHATLLAQRLFRHIGKQPESRIRWDEFRNKLQAFVAFEYADLRLGNAARERLSLNQLIERAEMIGPELSPFAIEGIGYHLVKSRLRDTASPDQLRFPEMLRGLPEYSLVLLHAGLGQALAEVWLHSVNPSADCEATQVFIATCRQNSLSGYAGITLEMLGFIARTLYPDLIDWIDRGLSANEEDRAYFWHGVGRGNYFAPENASPFRGGVANALETCLGTSDELGRQNALAGLAWTLTIINIGQPEIVARFLQHHAARLTDNHAFVDGVRSAVALWRQVSPHDTRIEAFPRYLPAYRNWISQDVWNRLVAGPVAEACRDDTRLIQKPEELFRHCSR